MMQPLNELLSSPGLLPQATTAGFEADITAQPDAKRHRHPMTQRLAVYNGSEVPTPEQFQRVECRDLGARSMSIYWPRKPNFERVVLELKSSGVLIWMVARVSFYYPSGNGDGAYLVGCRFEARLRSV